MKNAREITGGVLSDPFAAVRPAIKQFGYAIIFAQYFFAQIRALATVAPAWHVCARG
jgi:hypothetical protein